MKIQHTSDIRIKQIHLDKKVKEITELKVQHKSDARDDRKS